MRSLAGQSVDLAVGGEQPSSPTQPLTMTTNKKQHGKKLMG